MPLIGTEITDEVGLQLVIDWINSLYKRPQYDITYPPRTEDPAAPAPAGEDGAAS